MSDMSRTEAVQILKDMIQKTNFYSNHIIDACKIAISSLETNEAYDLEYESTKNDLVVDAVSRKALLDATVKKNSVWNKITNSEGDNLETIIAKLPSVTPQEPRKITLDDVKGYCKPRCLTIISNELLYELAHPKIKALEQEPRKGHWIKYDKDYFTAERLTSAIHSIRECSECHSRISDFYGTMNFCPHCGADMREVEE